MDVLQTRKEAPLDRYFRVIETISAFPRGLGLTELVAILDLPKTTVHRLLQGLCASGMLVSQNPRFGPYVLGERFFGLMQSSVSDGWLENLSRPILQEFVHKTGDTCFIARLSGNVINSAVMATPENAVHVYVVPGRELSPLYAAAAKAILAFQPATTVASVVEASNFANAAGPKSLEALYAELDSVRESGVASNLGEDIAGYAAIASPLHIPGLPVHFSVAVTGTYEKLVIRQDSRDLARLTLQYAKRLATAIQLKLQQGSDLAPF